MKEVVRSVCPGCQRQLTIPADWVDRTVKCKHCSQRMDVRRAMIPMAGVGVPPPPTWEPLPVGSAPVPQAQPATTREYVSAYDTRSKYSSQGPGGYRRKKGDGSNKLKGMIFGFLFVGLIGGGAIVALRNPDLFSSKPNKDRDVANNDKKGAGPVVAAPNKEGNAEPAASGSNFPRRMLAISIHNYLYANPLQNGDAGFAQEENRRTGTDAAIRKLADRWRIPKEQVYHLTDAAIVAEKKAKSEPRPDPKPTAKGGKKDPIRMVAKQETTQRISTSLPLKNVFEGTVTRFMESCRAQDRIVFVFCGHIFDQKGEAFLLPVEGDPEDPSSLIPLKWLYEQMAACPAQEKVAIFDVCRFHPERGAERPHNGPMTEALEKALHDDAPEGVSVVTSCSKGEQALELDYLSAQVNQLAPGVRGDRLEMHGSFFLSMMLPASTAKALTPENRLPEPVDEIPVERMANWIKDKLSEVVTNKYGSERKQTVKLTVKRRADPVPFDATEAMAAKFEFPVPPPTADPAAVSQIVREIQLPPVKSFREDSAPISVSEIIPFTEEMLKPYMAGALTGEPTNEFQKAIFEAVEEMRKQGAAGSGRTLPEEFAGENSDKVKEDLKKVQEVPARVEALLRDAKERLDEVAEMKDKQPKRWQAHYDYVMAQLKLRICYVNQYNLALANVRGGKFPELKNGENGFRLTAEATLDKSTPGEYKEMFKEAQKSMLEIAKSHPNTPWALLAKGDRTLSIGLRLTAATTGAGNGR